MNEYEKLATQLRSSIYWIETLIEVSDNDPDATQNWYIPALTLDYHGYMMEPFWAGIENMDDNVSKNGYFQLYAQKIIDNLTIRMWSAIEGVPYEDYLVGR